MTTNSGETTKVAFTNRDATIARDATYRHNLKGFAPLSIVTDGVNFLYKTKNVSIIMPVLNEVQNLPHVLPKIPINYEVIMVDGHSTDGTLALARQLRPDIRILFQPGKGKGDAMRHGFKHAKGDIIITFDADGSFNSEEITSFIAPLLDGYDLIKGSRFIHGCNTKDMPPLRRLGNRILTTMANVLFGTKYTDLVYGFHAFKRKALEKLNLESDGFEIDTELYLKAKKAGLKIGEVPSFENKRIYGRSNLRSFRDGWRILKTIITERIINHKSSSSITVDSTT